MAFMYAREELLPALSPTIAGWFAHAEQFQFLDRAFTFRADARRFEMGTPAIASVYTALGGMQIIQEIGVTAIFERTRFLVADLLARIEGQGWRARVAARPEQRSAIVMLEVAHAWDVANELRARNILVDSYDGLLRIAPYFYNTIEENALVIHAIAEILAGHRERRS
jgi:selenocysteine lyase/cysteine desulfurase